jgi:hypothetical protein
VAAFVLPCGIVVRISLFLNDSCLRERVSERTGEAVGADFFKRKQFSLGLSLNLKTALSLVMARHVS